jgi:replicative DNA helicase
MPSRVDASALAKLMLRVDAAADGAPMIDTVPTGFPSLDKLLGGGVRRGDLVVLGGDVGVGKSALALAIALRAAHGGHKVGFLTGEMDETRVLERALAIEGRTTIDAIRQGALDDAQRASLGAAALRLRDTLPQINRVPGGGMTAVADSVRRLLDVELVVIDSLQSLASGASTLDEELAIAVRQLKATAVDSHLAVILTAHLPGLTRGRADMHPVLDDFGALGAVKQHADVVLALFREELYQVTLGHEGATELAVLKNRNGGTSYIDLYFYKQWMRFEDMVD